MESSFKANPITPAFMPFLFTCKQISRREGDDDLGLLKLFMKLYFDH